MPVKPRYELVICRCSGRGLVIDLPGSATRIRQRIQLTTTFGSGNAGRRRLVNLRIPRIGLELFDGLRLNRHHAFRSLHGRPLQGARHAAVFWRHDFTTLPFEWVRFTSRTTHYSRNYSRFLKNKIEPPIANVRVRFESINLVLETFISGICEPITMEIAA